MWLPEAHASEGSRFPLRGAADPVQRKLQSLSHGKWPRVGRPRCLLFADAVRSGSLRAPSPLSTSGAVAPYGAAIMAPSLGATNTKWPVHPSAPLRCSDRSDAVTQIAEQCSQSASVVIADSAIAVPHAAAPSGVGSDCKPIAATSRAKKENRRTAAASAAIVDAKQSQK